MGDKSQNFNQRVLNLTLVTYEYLFTAYGFYVTFSGTVKFYLLLELVLSRPSLKQVCGAKILSWILRLLEYYCTSNSLNVRLLLKLTLFAARGFSFGQVATATLRFFAPETFSSANCSHSSWVLLDDSRDLFILITLRFINTFNFPLMKSK